MDPAAPVLASAAHVPHFTTQPIMHPPALLRSLSPIQLKTWPSLLASLLLLCGQAPGQNVDCRFSLYRTDTQFADALQTKLLTGGDVATQAMSKMPDLVKQGRATLLADLKKQTLDKQQDKVSSGTGTHKNRDGTTSRLGLDIEFNTATSPATGIVDCRLSFSYKTLEDDVVKSRLLQTSFTAKSAAPVLALRLQEGDINFLLVTSTAFETTATTGMPVIRIPYLDHSIYPTEADATANRNPVMRVVHPAKSGLANSASGGYSLYYKDEEDWESDFVGWQIGSEIVLSEDASLASMRIGASDKQPTGKTARSPNGFRFPEIIMRSAKVSAQNKIGQTHSVDMPVDPKAGDQGKAPSWKLSSKCMLYELK